ncbi:hypothetical protein [Fodinicola acaciae]|uniref:hypothetical protein n=1 Tax=Fodinicola acaciae TaxID=2681555 RepID=UPI0013D88943|nr:hypothetical protein [Fodinicola acaciae]
MPYHTEPLNATETRVRAGTGKALGKVQEMTASKLFVAMVDNHDTTGISYTVVGNYATHEEAVNAIATACGINLGWVTGFPGRVRLNTVTGQLGSVAGCDY